MNEKRRQGQWKSARVRPILLLSGLLAAVLVSTAILRRVRPESDRVAEQPTTTTTAPASGFTYEADDELNFRILRDGEPILIMKDGYRARFRCNTKNDHWIGTRRTPVHLGWSPWDAADVTNVSIHRIITPDHFELRISGIKPQLDHALFTTNLIGDRDAESGRISYSLVSELFARPADLKRLLGEDRIEYIDPWIEGVYWHERDHHDRELYHSFVFFDAESQTLTRTPKLHIFPSLPDGTYETLVTPMSRGAFALVDDHEPGLRFLVVDLSGSGSLGICWWTWDPHFYINLDDAEEEKLYFAMRIEEISQKAGARMIADAEPIPFESDPEHQVPSFVRDGVNRFDDMLDKSDEWGWEPHSTACRIDRTQGFDDDVSVTIIGEDDQTTAWYARTIGGDYFDHKRLLNGHSVSAMIRTDNAQEGARIGVVCYNGAESWLYRESDPVAFWSAPVTGRSDWVERSVKFDGTGFKRFKIVLEHSGPGQSWFDNVTLKRDATADGAGWHDEIIDWRSRDWSHPQDLPRRAFLCSRPEMRNDFHRIVMAWKDCGAVGPRLYLPEGTFIVHLTASADGCHDDPPILEVSVGDRVETHSIGIDGTSRLEQPFDSDGVSPIQIKMKFTNDGLCNGPQGDVDKNIFIHEVSVQQSN